MSQAAPPSASTALAPPHGQPPSTGAPAAEAELHRLSRRRWTLALLFSAGMAGPYFAVMIATGAAKGWMGTLLVPGLSRGVAVALSLIVLAWLLTVSYALWANGPYDRALARLRENQQ